MAADGAWEREIGAWSADPGATRTRHSLQQLSGVLDQLESRLAQAPDPALSPGAIDGLVETLTALAERITLQDRQNATRLAELGEALASTVGRTESQTQPLAPSRAEADEREAEILAPPAPRPAEAAPPTRAAEPLPLRATLAVSVGAAAISLVGAAVLTLAQTAPTKPVPSVQPRIALADLPLRPSLAPEPPRSARSYPSAPLPRARSADRTGAESYESVAAALAAGEATALARLTGLAQRGDGQAQLRLAGLYDTGAAGLPRDLAAARHWTRRAAEAGERIAMHNLGLFLMQGEGGDRDFTGAATWFRRAAARGVVDSQYNLGLLFEAGRGVPRNLREAYRWFSIAANAGDLASREKALALEARLAGGERAELDREAAGFQPGAASDPDLIEVIPPATTLAETQTLLARQGYYVGPVDGVPSPALRAAAQAYLQDRAAETPAPTPGTSP